MDQVPERDPALDLAGHLLQPGDGHHLPDSDLRRTLRHDQGGPANATLFLGLHLYENAFHFLKMGYASAMAWIMFLIIFVLTMGQFGLARRWVYYEGQSS